MAPKRASSKAAPSVDEAAKAALLAEKKGKALADTTHQEACEDDAVSKRQRNDQPTPEGSLRTCSSRGQPQEPPPGFAPLEGEDATKDGEVIDVSAEEQLQLRALRIKNRNLQKQKEILEAKRQHVSAQDKVRQMIRDEEQRAQELEQEIALMQREGQHDLQHGPPLQQRAPIGDLFIPQRGPVIPHAAAFQGINYLDERSPLAPQLQVSPWPANFRAGTYLKYNGSTDPAPYIMSYQVAVASSGGDDATMAKSFIIALEGPALTWYTRLPPLSIDSWRSLWDKFLLNFQGYRPDIDALAELSLCKQLEKETLREYYRKFLTLKSQLPSVDDQIAIHYAISGLRVGVLYSHCIRDPPKNLQEFYQLFEKYARSKELHQCKVESQRNPRTLHSPAEHGQDIRSQTPVGTAAVSSRCITLPTSTPLVRPLAIKIIPPGPRQWHSWSGPRTGAAAAQILLPVSRRRLCAPNEGLPRNEGHQGQDVLGATSRQPKSCRAHISTPPPTTIQPRPRSAST
jgi:DNA-binding transcriptional MerR regulator